MTEHRFCRVQLRTTDVAAAGAFYDAVIGGRGDGLFPLHESALAHGARPHWLGSIDLGAAGDVEAMAQALEARGATRLGPPKIPHLAVVRDVGGAVVAVTDVGGPSQAGIVWHQLNSADAARATQSYVELFGWALTRPVDLGAQGIHREFAWHAGAASVGAIGDIAGRPGVHPHWLFFFGVAALDAALDAVVARGGKVIGPTTLPSGARMAVCDDPQGAAFGLMERERARVK
jgi:uncharacterized protein